MSYHDEPQPTADSRALLLGYLDYVRGEILTSAAALDEHTADARLVPSGWTPRMLLNHLVYMERRWFRWGFLAEPVERPWGDHLNDERSEPRWAEPATPVAELAAALRSEAEATRATVLAHALTDRAAVGGRFTEAASAPDLQWILLHVIQEYAHHAGHLDIVVEQATAGQPDRG